MAYDPEKYRDKREKVLGIKKRGMGFGTIAMIVSMVILGGLSIVSVPQAISYMNTRHLDDAIFKLESGSSWPEKVVIELNEIEGVKFSDRDKHHARLVVTYDRRKQAFAGIKALFEKNNLEVTLLNQVNHRQHQNLLKNEEEELETP